MTLVQHSLFVALLVPLSYEEKMFGTALNNAQLTKDVIYSRLQYIAYITSLQLTHPLSIGIHDSRHAYVRQTHEITKCREEKL